MKFLRSIGLAALLMVGASSASAQVYYDMTQMSGQSGYRSEIYETVTTADFLRAPAMGFQRLAFTLGSAFAATVYACDTKTYVVATCTSIATLSATNQSIEVTTGRMWLIVDVTTAETSGNTSYLTIRSHSTEHSSGGTGGKSFALCSAETASGICKNAANTQDLYAELSGFSSFTVTFSETGGTGGNSCHLYIGDQALATSTSFPANLASIGQQITTIPLSASAPVFAFDFPVFWVWADCIGPALNRGNFSVNIQARR